MTSQVLTSKLPSKSRARLLRLAAQMAEEAERIGKRMAERRRELGLVQREVAERMPGTYQASDISRWERGKHRPEVLEEIGEALNTTVADLVAGPVGDRKEVVDPGGFLDELKAKEDGPELEALQLLGDQLAAVRAELLAELGSARSALEERLSRIETVVRNRAGSEKQPPAAP